MRITGGALGSRRLHVPRSADVRPMRDQVRAALFNILMDVVEGSRFLDLFAGTGSVGLEALSRGASEAVFVDHGREALELLRRNVAELEVGDRAEILGEDVFRALARWGGADRRFDLVFIGPPYGAELAHRTLACVAEAEILAPDAVVVTEIFKKETVQAEYGWLKRIDERLYGDNRLVLYRRT